MQRLKALDLRGIILFRPQLMLATSFSRRVSHYRETIRVLREIISLIRMTITYDSVPAGSQLSPVGPSLSHLPACTQNIWGLPATGKERCHKTERASSSSFSSASCSCCLACAGLRSVVGNRIYSLFLSHWLSCLLYTSDAADDC